jgi:4-hydroxythreonine-4-phosphate dehydrogenase
MTQPHGSPSSQTIAITMGDPAGIGPEIIAKLAQQRPATAFLVVGDVGVMARAVERFADGIGVRPAAGAQDVERGALSVIQVGPPLADDVVPGRVDVRAGAAAYAYVQRAIDLALTGGIGGVVTAPICKEAMALAGIGYPGHTEILADRCGVADFAMMLANDELRVLLVSIHVSLAQAIAAVTPVAELRAIRLADQACRAFGVRHPRVAVAGLNPHAGEAGLFGREEIEVIAPAIDAARAEGLDASGPWPGDTVFMRARQGEFDVVVAQYHDQGLIPVKYLGVDKGVNITVGLPFVRTSVDHGVAFDIAGTGRADASSLASAYDQALAMMTGNRSRGAVI